MHYTGDIKLGGSSRLMAIFKNKERVKGSYDVIFIPKKGGGCHNLCKCLLPYIISPILYKEQLSANEKSKFLLFR